MDIGEGVMAGRGSWEAESVGGSFLFACGFLWHFSFTRIAIASELQVYLKLCYCNVFVSHYLFCEFIYLFFLILAFNCLYCIGQLIGLLFPLGWSSPDSVLVLVHAVLG